MILQQGLPLLYQHFTALFKKNLLLSWRNKRSTCLQLFSSFFFILVIFCIEEAMKASEASSSAYKNVTDPTLLFSLPILPCEDKFFVKLPCYDFVWSGNNSRRVIDIVSAIMANNPGRPIPTNKVQSFKAPEEVDAWFMSHALQVPGVLHFVERNATTFKFLVPLQIAAEREIARSLMGDPKFGWDFGFKEFARPAIIAEVISALKIVSATGFPYSNAYPASRRAIWSLFPPNTFSAGLKLLLDATSTPASSGISWSERAVCEGGMSTCVLSIDIIYQWQVGTFLFWFVLAIYFDNIIPNASGVRKPIFYFLTPGYWTGKGGNKVEEGSIFSCIGSVPPVEHVAPEDQDVLEEETLVKQQAMDGIVDPNIAVPIHGLAETYPGTTKLGC
ncbi:ABC transporter A family member 11-like [Brassica napus]|uniref:ABC transporter A family member 11-like n=1 Tax=Brassica napus TaxID=3708 RepID=UPI0020785A5A|nr:ABC transporter A family member 11-like [Brassica napus]